MDTALYVFAGFLLVIITLAIGIPVLVRMLRAPKAPATGGATKTGFTNPLKGVSLGTWWIIPLVLWLVFLAILMFLFPCAWHVLWRNQALFWIVQVVYGIIAISGKDKKNWRGKPVRPGYIGLLFFTVVSLVIVAIAIEAFGGEVKSPKQVGINASLLLTSTEKSVAVEVKKSEPIKRTFVVSENEVSTVTLPAGYRYTRVDGKEKVSFTLSELDGNVLEMEFSTKEVQPVEVTVWAAKGSK